MVRDKKKIECLFFVKHCCQSLSSFCGFISSSKISWPPTSLISWLPLVSLSSRRSWITAVEPRTQPGSRGFLSAGSCQLYAVSVVPGGGLTMELMKFQLQGPSLMGTPSKPMDFEYCVRRSSLGMVLC